MTTFATNRLRRTPGGGVRRVIVPLALSFLGLTSGCMVVGPNYVSPATEGAAPDEWVSAVAEGITTESAELAQWWTLLDDPVLDTLVDAALVGNLDLEQAHSRVREARARRGIAASARLPDMGASGSAASVREGTQSTGERYTIGFDAAWEIDLFGRVTRSIEAATADVQAQIEAGRGARVSLLAELALSYVEYRSYEKRLHLAHANVQTLERTLDIVNARFESELADRLQIAQAESNLGAGRSRIPPLETGLRRAAYRLAVLVGRRPGALADILEPERPIPAPPATLAIGIPADLLRRRPDLRLAERELAAQSARVGVAIADLYPRFSFNGMLQFSAADVSTLMDDAGRSSRIGPAFSWRVFNAGSVRNNIRVQSEKQEQALLQYEQTVLLALEETENAMVAYIHEQTRRQTLAEAAAAARRAAELAESLYQDGLKDFIHVLDAQRIRVDAEDRLAISEAEVVANLIRLYKALGGGWPGHDAVSP